MPPENFFQRHGHFAQRGAGAQRLEHAGERLSVHELHGEEGLAVYLPEVEDLRDVAVAESHRDLRLVDEHRDELFVLRDVRQDPLDGDELFEATRPRRPREEDLAHAALAETPHERVAPEALSFDVGDYVVYPKHGVGRVVELQNEEIAGMKLELYVLRFEKERMTLRVPVNKVEAIGMRKLSSDSSGDSAAAFFQLWRVDREIPPRRQARS